jgi:hypothetical protein
MGEWRVYKMYVFWRSDFIYMVGRKIDENGTLDSSNIEWEGFYSYDQNEAIKFARELNKNEGRI